MKYNIIILAIVAIVICIHVEHISAKFPTFGVPLTKKKKNNNNVPSKKNTLLNMFPGIPVNNGPSTLKNKKKFNFFSVIS